MKSKGIYSLITTFLFIMVLLFAVISMIYMGSVMKLKKAEINDEMIKYNYMMDAKNRLLSKECYGQIIDEAGETMSANDTCIFPGGVIKGYVIEMLIYDNCTDVQKTWEHKFSDEDGESFPYFVPIRAESSGNICPGRLKVIY